MSRVAGEPFGRGQGSGLGVYGLQDNFVCIAVGQRNEMALAFKDIPKTGGLAHLLRYSASS